MAQDKDCCFFGRGDLYISGTTNDGSWGCNWSIGWGDSPSVNAPARKVGNVSSLSLSIDYEQKQVLNLGKGNYEADCSVCIVNSVDFSMTMNCFSDENLKEALLGDVKKVTASTEPVTDHVVCPTSEVPFECGTLIPFNAPGVDCASVVITRTDDNSVLTEGVDYTCDSCGVSLLTGFALPANVGLQLQYGYAEDYTCIEPLTRSCQNVHLTFKGCNIANNNSPFIVDLYNVKLSPTSTLDLIGEDFSTLELTGTLEPDNSITGEGFSKYFSIKRIGA